VRVLLLLPALRSCRLSQHTPCIIRRTQCNIVLIFVMTRRPAGDPIITPSVPRLNHLSLVLTAPPNTTHIYRHGAAERSGAASPGQQQRGGQEERRGTWCEGLVEGIAGKLGVTGVARRPFLVVRDRHLLALLLSGSLPKDGQDALTSKCGGRDA